MLLATITFRKSPELLIILCISSSLIEKEIQKFLSGEKKIQVKACTKPILWDAKYDHENTNWLQKRNKDDSFTLFLVFALPLNGLPSFGSVP